MYSVNSSSLIFKTVNKINLLNCLFNNYDLYNWKQI